MFKVEPLDLDEKYPTYSKWWKDWGWQAFPAVCLPQEGVRITHEGKDVCAVFIYTTQTPIYWIENYISDKECPREIRDEALNLLIDEALKKAKEMGGMLAMSAVNSSSLKKRLENKKFMKTDENLTGFIRRL